MKNEGYQGNNTMKWVLPTDPDPLGQICYVVPVPDSKYHITAFLGSIYDLSLWWNWEKDDAHTARLAAWRWRQIWAALQIVDCDLINVKVSETVEVKSEMELRIAEVNGECVVQWKKCSCPDAWVTLANASDSGSQPGTGQPQPQPGGGTADYSGCLNANSNWNLPTNVNSGDVIQITSINGAWNDPDADGLFYRCFDGNRYVAGFKVPGTTELIGTDPAPTVAHMGIVAIINNVFYDLTGLSLTVPSGVVNAPVIFMANDSNLINNSGQMCFTVKITNNQSVTTTFTHTWLNGFGLGALAVDSGAYDSVSDSVLNTTAVTSVEYTGQVHLTGSFPNVTSVSVTYRKTTNVGAFRDYVSVNNGGSFNYDTGAETGTFVFSVPVTGISAALIVGVTADNPSGSASILQIQASGPGADPF